MCTDRSPLELLCCTAHTARKNPLQTFHATQSPVLLLLSFPQVADGEHVRVEPPVAVADALPHLQA